LVSAVKVASGSWKMGLLGETVLASMSTMTTSSWSGMYEGRYDLWMPKNDTPMASSRWIVLLVNRGVYDVEISTG